MHDLDIAATLSIMLIYYKLNKIEHTVINLQEKVAKLEAEKSILASENELNAKRIKIMENVIELQGNLTLKSKRIVPSTSRMYKHR